VSAAPRAIRVLINAAAARRGGGQTYLRNLLAFQPEELGLQVYVAGPESLELPSRPDVHRVQVRWPIENPLTRRLWESVRLPSLLRRLRADVLFLPSGTSPGPPGPWKRVSMFRNMLPFVPEQCAKYSWGYMRLRNHLLRRSMAASMRDADLVIFVSEHGREVVTRSVAVSKAVVIPHGISPAFRTAVGERPGWLPSEDYILYVSTLDFYKAQLEVLRGYALARQAGVRDKLVFVGPEYPPYGRKVRAEIDALGLQEHVRLAGMMPYADLPAAYAHSHVNIFASECENCPNILLEAMAAGRPLLCSNRPPMPEFGGASVVYFDPADPAQFARELVSMLTDPKRMDEYAERAKDQSRSYDWQSTARSTWEAIAALGASSPGESADRELQ
jgi:glycosyltransferase involved in cell wall biosynthesis